MQLRLRGAAGDAGHLGDLLVSIAFDPVQDEHRSGSFRQPGDGLLEVEVRSPRRRFGGRPRGQRLGRLEGVRSHQPSPSFSLRTPVGEHENSASPYGTYDQGGNLWEWNEAVINGSVRDLRGGSFIGYHDYSLHAASRYLNNPTYETDFSGFRVARVSGNDPVPTVSEWGVAVMALMILTTGTLVLTRRPADIDGALRRGRTW